MCHLVSRYARLWVCVCFRDFWGHVYDLMSDIIILDGLSVILHHLHVDFPLAVWVLEGDTFQFPKETSGWAWRTEPTNWSHCSSLKAMLPIQREVIEERTLEKARPYHVLWLFLCPLQFPLRDVVTKDSWVRARLLGKEESVTGI